MNVTNLRTVGIAVTSVIAVVIIVGLITMAMTPSNKTEDNALASASEPVFFDAFGFPLSRVTVGEQVLIQSEITNKQAKMQPFVYIVQVTNSEGITISLSYMKLELPANDKFKVAQSWTPDAPGKYDIEIFVWDSIEGQTVLSPTRKISVEVLEF